MRLKAKDLIRILSAVDGDSDVVFHLDEDDNHRLSADIVTFKEGQYYDGDFKETEMTVHIALYSSGTYDPRLDEADDEPGAPDSLDEIQEQIIQALRRHGGDRKAAAEELGISERTLYRKMPRDYRG